MKTILAPIDFSSVSDAVVAGAASLARAVEGRLVLLTVIQPPEITHQYAAMLENIPEMIATGEKNAARRLEDIEKKLKGDLVPVESVQLVGAPILLIVEQAEKFDADYIVMGSHGHTALYDLLVGSTTHGVLKRAVCPVIVIPAVKGVKAAAARKQQQAFA